MFSFRKCFKLSMCMICLSSIVMVFCLYYYKNHVQRIPLKRWPMSGVIASRVRINRRFQNTYECNPIDVSSQQYSVKLDGYSYPMLIAAYNDKSINFNCLNSNGGYANMKRILVWNVVDQDWKDFRYGFGFKGPFIAGKCPVVNCEVTDDKRFEIALSLL
jgi:hypothetical protein